MNLASQNDLVAPAHVRRPRIWSWRAKRVVLVWLVCSLTSLVHAQETGDERSRDPSGAPRFGPWSEPTIWEFGLEISAIDRCREVRSFAPLPVEWPDQSIQLVDEARSESVSTLAKDFPGKIRLLQVNADRLETGDVARAIHKYVVRKRDVLPPLDPAQLTIPKNVKGELKPFVQESPFIETTHAKVKKLAASIEVDASAPAWNQVEMIYDAIRERFPYEFDPTIRSCPDAIEAGKGDCEELTSLFIAVCRIRKIPARAVWIPGHTYAEFYLVDAAGEGHWYPCQLAGTRLFGEMQEARPILQKGDKFTVPLSNKPTRYVAPQLLAAEGACSLSWIARQAEQPAPREPSR